MRFSLVAITCLVGSTIASPVSLESRDVTVIDASFKRITNSLNKLTAGFNQRASGGDSKKAEQETNKLLNLAQTSLEECRFSAREIRRGPNVNAFEAVGLLNMVNSLTSQIRTVVDGWVDAKRMVQAGGKKAAVLNALLDASEATTNLGDAIISKLPVLDRPLAQQFQSAFVRVYETAITDYKDEKH